MNWNITSYTKQDDKKKDKSSSSSSIRNHESGHKNVDLKVHHYDYVIPSFFNNIMPTSITRNWDFYLQRKLCHALPLLVLLFTVWLLSKCVMGNWMEERTSWQTHCIFTHTHSAQKIELIVKDASGITGALEQQLYR